MYSVHYVAVCIMYAIENNTICVHHRNGTYCATRDKHVLDSVSAFHRLFVILRQLISIECFHILVWS